jgi:ribosomal protein L11 methyltransferase
MYSPFNIGTLFRIAPPGSLESKDRIDLIIAKGAFGSGEHETTASCLEILETLPDIKDSHLLDLGSGTGILALATLKLGAKCATCIDISPDAVKTCRINCEHNGVEDRVRHVTGSLDTLSAEETFDLIIANIYGDLLLDLAEGLVKHARPDSYLLLSGMLWEYNFEVRKKYSELGCTVLENRMLDEFSTVLLRKKGSS